jgi:hypothetical protein
VGTAARLLVIVQRGRLGVYETLKTRFEPDGGAVLVQIRWDRRLGERRTPWQAMVPERRQSERRRAPPPTWETLGVVHVHLEAP